MKAVNLKELKEELKHHSPNELLDLCLRLAVFKKENKEYLTYLLFESENESSFVEGVKLEIDEQFLLINKKTYYLMKKSVRKVLTHVKKQIRYSKNKQTEIELMLYFLTKLKKITPSISRSPRLMNLFNVQVELIRKKLPSLHEDLQHDVKEELEALLS
jgi:hypothetical protein